MLNLIEMLFDFAILSTLVCVVSFVGSKIDGVRSERHRVRTRKFCIVGIVCGVLGGLGEIWLHPR